VAFDAGWSGIEAYRVAPGLALWLSTHVRSLAQLIWRNPDRIEPTFHMSLTSPRHGRMGVLPYGGPVIASQARCGS